MTEKPRFGARTLEKVVTKPGCWESTRVGVFDDDTQVAEYLRNYPGYATTTFHAFEQDGRWFALYSKEYMYTRVMSLPDGTDLGGEDASNVPYPRHFCPMEYHVPLLTIQDLSPDDPNPGYPHDATGETREAGIAAWNAWYANHPFVTRYARWGFVGGCAWGDDTSMKLQFLDLSRAAEGVLVRDDRFGYLELPPSVPLALAVDTDGIHSVEPPEETVVTIAVPKRFALTGKPCD